VSVAEAEWTSINMQLNCATRSGGKMSEVEEIVEAEKKRVAPLTILLGIVFVVFCGMLIFVYVATKRANPIMLDLEGKPTNAPADSSNTGKK
jgi:hypothetical protein